MFWYLSLLRNCSDYTAKGGGVKGRALVIAPQVDTQYSQTDKHTHKHTQTDTAENNTLAGWWKFCVCPLFQRDCLRCRKASTFGWCLALALTKTRLTWPQFQSLVGTPRKTQTLYSFRLTSGLSPWTATSHPCWFCLRLPPTPSSARFSCDQVSTRLNV